MGYELLQKIGLSQNEIKIYESLLKQGLSNANEISRDTGIHRISIYDSLRSLREKGLVSLVNEGKKQIYAPANPEMLLDLIEEKENDLKKTKKLIPELTKYYNGTKTKQEIISFKGLAGIKNLLRDMLTSKTDLLDFGAEHWSKVYLGAFYIKWEKERSKQKINLRAIANERIKGVKLELSEIRWIPKHHTSRVSTYVYDNKVAMIMWSDKPLGILIKDNIISESYRNYFEFMWKNAKK